MGNGPEDLNRLVIANGEVLDKHVNPLGSVGVLLRSGLGGGRFEQKAGEGEKGEYGDGGEGQSRIEGLEMRQEVLFGVCILPLKKAVDGVDWGD